MGHLKIFNVNICRCAQQQAFLILARKYLDVTIRRPSALQLIARLRRRSLWLTATVSFAVARHGHATRNWDTTA